MSCVSQKTLQKSENINKVIGEARTYIGTPYLWGGNDKNGIDCSGLLVRSFESVGVKLPRTTNLQVEIGKKVSLKKTREGDLVFLAFGKNKRKITHVGLISETTSSENINFIHASSSKGVIETPLLRDYYLRRIKKIKRVF